VHHEELSEEAGRGLEGTINDEVLSFVESSRVGGGSEEEGSSSLGVLSRVKRNPLRSGFS
jgi:hypothetical protein